MRILLLLPVVAFPVDSVHGSSGQTGENGLVSDDVTESILRDGEEPHTDSFRWSAPRLFHTVFEEEYEGRINVSTGELPSVLPEAVYSENEACYFLLVLLEWSNNACKIFC